MDMLDTNPDRLGHVIFTNDEIFESLVQQSIPIEICLTSNLICKQVEKYEDHHFGDYFNIDYPLSLCTDDTVMFDTTVSKEYYHAHKNFNLSKEQLRLIAFKSFDYCFLSKEKISELKCKYFNETV